MNTLLLVTVTLIGSTVLHAGEVENDVGNKDKRILLEDNYNTIVSKLDKLTADVANLKAQQESPKQRVAFKANLAKILTPGTGQLIVFDDVRFNLGHAYHHGTFVAPYNGTYLFSVHMCSATDHWIIVNLLRNSAIIGQVLAGDTEFAACSSETTITELEAGENVTVQHKANLGDYIYGDVNIQNSFTGVLLF